MILGMDTAGSRDDGFTSLKPLAMENLWKKPIVKEKEYNHLPSLSNLNKLQANKYINNLFMRPNYN